MMNVADYGPFPYVSITQRPKLELPNNARVAVWVIPNIEFFPLTHGLAGHAFEAKGKAPTVRPWAQRDYGNRVGIWRIMDVMNKLGIRASATLNAAICDHHPQIVKAGTELGWEFLGHNETNVKRLTEMEPEEERQTIQACVKKIKECSGKRPVGWLGSALAETWHTLDYLIEEGFDYVADWTNDDQPYMMTVNEKKIVSVPYSYEEGAESGRVMAICLHPFIIGVPHRIKGLESALKYIQSHDQVWFATGSEIAHHYVNSGATI